VAYFDHEAYRRKRERLDSYNALKEWLSSTGPEGKVSGFILAREHLLSMEQMIEEQEAELTKFRDFFSMFQSLLPSEVTTFGGRVI
jgi:hypothetical protein